MKKQLNGPQTTGRQYRNLSEPQYGLRSDIDIPIEMRGGTKLLADVHRPDQQGRFPALLAASPYPRQIQDLGAPAGLIEAGVTNFWVPRGYVHVIANLRGTNGSGGTFNFFDGQERQDVYDLVEWVAAQPWCDGNVGMIGISYFAMTQLEAAVERPPHLKAIFPLALTADLYEFANHHGLLSASFVTPFLAMLGLAAERSNKMLRGKLIGLARRVLNIPRIHKKFETSNGEAAVTMLRQMLRLPHNPHPWDELWLDFVVNHPNRDEWWEQRNLLPLLKEVDIPVYLGCDWENVPLHLPSTFRTWKGLSDNACVRMGMLDKFGLTWPWESMHIEALAWYDHWLKGKDTGILEGPPIRYFLPGADKWCTAESWPPSDAPHQQYALRADGTLSLDEGQPGSREFVMLGTGWGRDKRNVIDLPPLLTWTSAPLTEDTDIVGDIELRLVASATAIDTAWMATLRDVAPDGETTDVTAGWLRASMREVDEAASRPGAPVLPCRYPRAVPIGEDVVYRIPLVPNARRFKQGHRIQLVLTSDDQDPAAPAIMSFRHASVGTSSLNTVRSSSRLLIPVLHSAAVDVADG